MGGAAALYFLRRQRRTLVLATFAASSLAFIAGIFAWAAVRVDRHQHAAALVAKVRQAEPAAEIAGYRFLQASLVYYAGGPVPCFDDPPALRRYLAAARRPFIFTTDDCLPQLEAQFPGAFCELARRPYFLGRGQVVVLRRTPGR